MIFKAVSHLPEIQQKEKAVALMRAVDLPVALEKGQQLAAAIANPETARAAKAQVAGMIEDVFKFFNSFDDSEELQTEILRTILATYSNLNIEEIALALQMGKLGKFGKEGKVYGKINGAVVMGWLKSYADSDAKLSYWERRNADFRNQRDDDAQLDLPAGISLKKGDGGVFEFTTAALVAPAETAPISKAEWHRREAARLQRIEDEAEGRRVFAREKARVMVGQINAKAAFEAYAKESYYSKLTDRQKEVLKASEHGVITDEAVRLEYAELVDWWQIVVFDWENRDADEK